MHFPKFWLWMFWTLCAVLVRVQSGWMQERLCGVQWTTVLLYWRLQHSRYMSSHPVFQGFQSRLSHCVQLRIRRCHQHLHLQSAGLRYHLLPSRNRLILNFEGMPGTSIYVELMLVAIWRSESIALLMKLLQIEQCVSLIGISYRFPCMEWDKFWLEWVIKSWVQEIIWSLLHACGRIFNVQVALM